MHGSSGSSGTPTTASFNLSGNWEILLTPTGGAAVPGELAGFINQQASGTAGVYATTASLQAVPIAVSGCYGGDMTFPLQGTVKGTELGLGSFFVDDQRMNLAASANAAGTLLTGTYLVQGGCSDGAKGTLQGQRFSLINGTYNGSLGESSQGRSASFTLNQLDQGSGSGEFFVSGSGTLRGFSCFSKAALSFPDGYVVGSHVTFSFTTDDPNGSRVVVSGLMDTKASLLTLQSVKVVGGSCSEDLGSATLTLGTN